MCVPFCYCKRDICTALCVLLLQGWSSHTCHETISHKCRTLSKTHQQYSSLHNFHSRCRHAPPHPHHQECLHRPWGEGEGEVVLRVWTVVQVPAAELTSNITLNFSTWRRPLKLSREFQLHFNDDYRILSNKGLDSLFNHVWRSAVQWDQGK